MICLRGLCLVLLLQSRLGNLNEPTQSRRTVALNEMLAASINDEEIENPSLQSEFQA